MCHILRGLDTARPKQSAHSFSIVRSLSGQQGSDRRDVTHSIAIVALATISTSTTVGRTISTTTEAPTTRTTAHRSRSSASGSVIHGRHFSSERLNGKGLL